MKVILFDITDEAGFNSVQSRIHNHLLTKSGTGNFKYSGNCYSDFNRTLSNGTHKALFIDTASLGYAYILEALTQSEEDSIVDIDNNWGSPQTLV